MAHLRVILNGKEKKGCLDKGLFRGLAKTADDRMKVKLLANQEEFSTNGSFEKQAQADGTSNGRLTDVRLTSDLMMGGLKCIAMH